MSDRAEIAHLLKRTSFNVSLKQVEELTALDWEQALNVVVDKAAPPQVIGKPNFRNYYLSPDDEDEDYDKDFYLMVEFELARLANPIGGLGDRMLWFWHGLITSGYSEVDVSPLLYRQHKLLAKHALGNFREMMIDITTDAAMLTYLSGDGSTGDAPNENYAREVMELFTLGRNNYQQSDVKAAAKALAGWYLKAYPSKSGPFDPNRIKAFFDPESAYNEPVTYLGVTAKFDVPAIINQIFKQDACATHTAKKIFQHFVHSDPDEKTIHSLGAVFRNANYEIKPLLAAIFRHPDFLSSKARATRIRLPLEILLATAAAFSMPVADLDHYTYFNATKHWIFDPPNVAGWPLDNRWLSAPQALARISLGLTAFELPNRNSAVQAISQAKEPVLEALKQASLYEVSTTTLNEFNRVASSISSSQTRAKALLALAIASPEFAIS